LSKVLVTGAGGFIGSHLVERLVAEGRHVRAFVEYDSRGSWGWLDDVGAPTKSSTGYSDRADVVASQLELPAAIPSGELDTAPHPLDIGENAAVRQQ
jgi:nucleoside-diphosphate-sugar epimerase